MGFVHVHLIPYVRDVGFTHIANANAQFLLALVSIAGALLTGKISDRIGRRRPMSLIFFWRGLAYLGFFLLALWQLPLLLYAAVICMGLSWSSTVSLLATSCADLYGRRSQGSVFGVVFGVMNWSSTLGAWLPGYMFDLSGSYQSALVLKRAHGLGGQWGDLVGQRVVAAPATRSQPGGLMAYYLAYRAQS